jgi:hypothetical protein
VISPGIQLRTTEGQMTRNRARLWNTARAAWELLLPKTAPGANSFLA